MSPKPDDRREPAPQLDVISERIRGGEKIRFSYPDWGTFEIDGAQPFVCLHREDGTIRRSATRRRADPEMASLLTPMASHVLLAAGLVQEAGVHVAIARILEALEEVHGTVLLAEIWAGHPIAPPIEGGIAPQHLRIRAPEHFAPAAFLECFETAALATAWPGGEPTVEIEYSAGVQPPGCAPLPLQLDGRTSSATAVGLEVTANFRSLGGSLVYPEVLRETRRALVHVLKQSIYRHVAPRTRAPHFHALGAGEIEEPVFRVDREIATLSERFDLLLLVTPVNVQAEWRGFEASRFERLPEFHYRPVPVEPSALKRALHAIPVEEIDDPALHAIYADKRTELDRQLTLLRDRGTPAFSLGSLQVYGRTEGSLLEQAHSLLERFSDRSDFVERREAIDAEELLLSVTSELAYYRSKDPNFDPGVELRDDVTGLLVSRGRVLIGRDAMVSRARVDAALQHEVGIHSVTHHNGRGQRLGILHAGMAAYEELQEGLATIAELLIGELTPARVRQLASRVIAAHAMEVGADFVEAFRLLNHTWGVPAASAYATTMRAFRSGGFAKDAIYLRGMESVRRLLGRGVDLDDLLVGKIASGGVDLLDELRWRGLIAPPRLRPRFLERADVVDRIERVRKSGSLAALIAEEVP